MPETLRYVPAEQAIQAAELVAPVNYAGVQVISGWKSAVSVRRLLVKYISI